MWTTNTTQDAGDYFEFCISATSGFVLDVSEISFDFRSSGSGPVYFDIAMSVDGGAYANLSIDNISSFDLPDPITNNPVLTFGTINQAAVTNDASQVCF
ncbi:MAG: hypothetical protein H6554_04085 [Chitinophagales bacterium]|nr:hypothetical protein [Chitinophagales bacterium]